MTDRLVAILEKAWIAALAPVVVALWDSVLFWRIFALVGWTIIAVAWYQREWVLSLILRPQYREHDTEVFLESENIFSEEDWRQLYFQLSVNRRYDRELFHKILFYREFFDAEQNKYLLPQLRKASDRFLCSLDHLTDFIPMHFCPDPRWLDEGSFEPWLREQYTDENSNKKYCGFLEELDELATQVDERRREYERVVSRLLPHARHLARQALENTVPDEEQS